MKRPHLKLPSSLARFKMGGENTPKPKPTLTKNQIAIKPVINNIGDTINLFTSDFDDVQDDLPKAFQGLLDPLKLTRSAFSKYYKDATNVAEAEKDSATAGKIKTSIKTLEDKTKRLDTICRAAIRADAEDTAPLARYEKAVESPDDRVEVLIRAILERALKDIAKEPYITAAEVKGLEEALKEVKKLPASLPENNETAGKHIYNNYGSGQINVAHGDGDINVNTGPGPQIKGNDFHNLSFGVPVTTSPAKKTG